MTTKISAFIIAFNEEKIIEQCLKKLNWVDEIIVVDSGSTDNTVAISEKYNAKVFYKKFEGYGEQKQFALDQTTNDWVLNLDADEILTDDLVNEIQEQLQKEVADVVGYRINCRHVFMKKTFNYGNESNRSVLRLFNKKFGKYDNNSVHEGIELEGKIVRLKKHYLHYSYSSYSVYIRKLNLYTQLSAENKFKKNKKYSFLAIVLKTKFEFIKKYIFELNFLNGQAGFHWSVLSSFSTYLKCIKTNECYK